MFSKCFIWSTPAETVSFSPRRGAIMRSARAGGDYRLRSDVSNILNQLGDNKKLLLTTWLVDQRRLGESCPTITSDLLKRLDTATPLYVEERANRLLMNWRNQNSRISASLTLSQSRLDQNLQAWVEDDTLSRAKAWTESLEWEEVWYLIEFLESSRFIRRKNFISRQIIHGPNAGRSGCYEAVITPKGHAHIADLEGRRADSKQAFIAMWFHDSMNKVYAAIADAVRDAGYQPLRIDRKEHNNKIDDEIIAEIRRSRFLVADFTHGDEGMRGGVYYEAGFARGMGLEVISTCRNDLLTEQKIHFDTRQYNHIGWTEGDLAKFKLAVSNRISATIGEGPLKLTS